jgi:predicted permease
LLGLVVANWGARSLLLFLSDRSQRLPFDVHPNATVLGFTAAVSILTGLLFGLAPALRATRVDVAPRLKDSSAAASGRFTLARGLVAAQVAFSLLLLIGAGLFLRTLLNLERQDLGFDRQNVLLFSLDPIRAGYRGGRLASVYTQTVEKLRGLPGVRSATASGLALLSGWSNSTDMAADGAPLKTGDNRGVFWNSVGPEFFETMGMRLTLGRDISLRDIQSRARVAVVNEAMARYFLPGENPLGHRFSFGTRFDPAQAYEIVGVAQNANFDRLRQTPPRTAYISYAALEHLGSIYFEVRTAADPLALAPSVRQAVRSIDPGLPLLNLGTQELVAQDAMLQERLFARLCAFFGGLALLLVCMGLYGTVTYAVTRRTSEIGIRMALGAGRGGVLWMVLRESLLLIAAGLVLGLPAAFAATRLIESQLYGVRRNDAVTIAITMALLLFAGAAAGFFPARRASRIDPIRALRYE